MRRSPATPRWGFSCAASHASIPYAHATDRNSIQKEAERRFPHRVDIPVPGSGLGRRLTEMHDWYAANVSTSTWAQHGHQERRKGEMPIDFARFYFATEADAGEFTLRW